MHFSPSLKSLLIAVVICGAASAQVSFEKQRDAVIFRAVQVFSVDLNNDHHDDLISLPVSDNATTLAVSLANRDGTFRAGPTYDTGTTATGLVSGDFNHDGKADIAFITQNALSVFLGNGDGSLRPGFTFPLSLRPGGIASADFNLDGNQDLAILGQFKVGPRPGVDYAMQVVIFFGDGAGGFTEPSTVFSELHSPFFPGALLTGDFNGDHIPDFAFSFTSLDRAELGTTVVHVLYGTDSLQYVDTQATYALGEIDEMAADVDSDGRSDLLMSFAGGPNHSSGIAILYGTDARTFVRKDLDTPGWKLGVADFNGDGRNDVVATFSNYPQSGIDVLLQQSDGTFAPPQQYVVTGGGDSINLAIGDFNGDRKPDIAVPTEFFPLPSGFAVELKNTTPPTTPLLTALSPLDGASVASSFWVRVDAASARRITGMLVYVDGVTIYATTQSFVDAVLPLTSGTHRVTVRAWNNIGQFGTYTASIHVVGSTSTVPLLQVSSPGNDHLVPSPLWVRVNATSPAGIAGISVYVDNVARFATTAAFVDKTFPVGTGIHFVTVRGWNSKGEFSTYQARVGVP